MQRLGDDESEFGNYYTPEEAKVMRRSTSAYFPFESFGNLAMGDGG